MTIDTVNRFAEKKAKDQATRVHQDHREAFEELKRLQPDYPIWPLVAQLQTLFADSRYVEEHPRFETSVGKGDDSIAVLWKNVERGEGELFLSIQATARQVPRAAQVAPPEMMDEFLEMIEDINSNNASSVTATMVRTAVLAFKDYHVVCLDGDPESNTYTVQAYTRDRKHLVDLQLDYGVVQESILHRARV